MHLLVIFDADFIDGGNVGSVVEVRCDALILHHQSLNFLVVQDCAQPTAGCLLETHHLTAWIIKRKIEQAHVAVFGSAASADHRHVDHIVFILGVLAGKLFGQEVGIVRIFFSLFNFDTTIIAVDKDQ